MPSKDVPSDRGWSESTSGQAVGPSHDRTPPTRPGSAPSAEASPRSDYLTLAQAAALAPGRPSANCLWRWCRRGVLARTGARVRLRHVRHGGRVYTRAAWLEAFGRDLADADRQYFEPDPPNSSNSKGRVETAREVRRGGSATSNPTTDHAASIDAELDAEGL